MSTWTVAQKRKSIKFNEYDVVRVLKDGKCGVKKGEVGAILMVFKEPKEAYEVEVFDEKGNTKAQYTFFPEELELIRI